MISGFDHVVVAVRDLAAGGRAYETLLGRACVGRSSRDGVAVAAIGTDNLAVELMAPVGDGAMADRLRKALDDGGEGLKSLVFRSDDLDRAHTRAERVGLAPEAIATSEVGKRTFRLNTERTRGVRIFLSSAGTHARSASAVGGLDHIVVQTSCWEGAGALYGARLGLDMRLDREVAGRRLMFFRCGDAVVEIAEKKGGGRDLLWGLSWRVTNADAARERLASAGVNVSEVRTGFKPGTRVFTVRDRACGVATLMIETAAGDRR